MVRPTSKNASTRGLTTRRPRVQLRHNATRPVQNGASAAGQGRESEERFRTAFEMNPAASVISRLHDGRIIDANRAFLRIFGYPKADVIGKSGRDLHLWASDADRKRVRRTADDSRGEALEVSLRAGDGSFRYGTASARQIAIDGEPCLIWMFYDLTAGRHAQQTLRESEETMRGLLESASEAILTVDKSARITYLNARTEAMFAYRRNELLGKRIEVLVPARFQKQHVHERTEFMKSPIERPMGRGRDLTGRRKDGTEFPVEISLSPVETRGGTLVLALVTDITERRAAEEQQRAYAERLETVHEIDRAILAGRTVPEIAGAAARRLIDALKCARVSILSFRESGALVTEAVQGIGEDLTPVGTVAALTQELADLPRLRRGKVQRLDVRRRKPTPTLRELKRRGLRSLVLVPMRSGGTLVGLVTIWSTDPNGVDQESVTTAVEVADQIAVAIRQARLLEQVQRHAVELEERVAERTAALQEVNDELQAFAYSVSHDLRAPLRAMRGFGQALLEDYGAVLDAVARDFTTRIVDAAEHMDELIQDLLSYSRVSRSQFRPEPVDLGHAIAQALRQNHEAIDAAAARVSNGLAGITVLGHEQTIVQVLANLISNAVKFARPGTPASVALGAENAHGWVRFWVQDNGIGIKKEHHARIFRVFERLHGMDQYPGTGIGLAIVRKGVERMGGRSGVESRPGKGSKFWVELPSA